MIRNALRQPKALWSLNRIFSHRARTSLSAANRAFVVNRRGSVVCFRFFEAEEVNVATGVPGDNQLVSI